MKDREVQGSGVIASSDLSVALDLEAIRLRELGAQESGARPGVTDHPEDGESQRRVKKIRRQKDSYRRAARCHPNITDVPTIGEVEIDIVSGDWVGAKKLDDYERGAWVGCRYERNQDWDIPTRFNSYPYCEVYITADDRRQWLAVESDPS